MKINYILVEYYKVNSPNPYYFQEISNIESKMLRETRVSVHKFTDRESLASYLGYAYKTTSRYELFEVSNELTPVLETKTIVSFK